MDYNGLEFWFQVVQFVATTILGVYVYVANRNVAKTHRVKQFEDQTDKRFENHAGRITRVEEAMRHMPNHADMTRIETGLKEVYGAVEKTNGGMEGLRRAVDVIQQHLLNNQK